MRRDNKDRSGYAHRKDAAYVMGESKPGDVGDSEGTFHDRAGTDNNVIVDGKAKRYETHKKNQMKTQSASSRSGGDSKQGNQNSSQTRRTVTSRGQYAELDGEIIEVEVDRISGSGNPIGAYRGFDAHVPNGEPGETYEVNLNAKSGYFVGDPVSTSNSH